MLVSLKVRFRVYGGAAYSGMTFRLNFLQIDQPVLTLDTDKDVCTHKCARAHTQALSGNKLA